MNRQSTPATRQLPAWTWWMPLLLFHLAVQFSLFFKYDQGVSTFYLPTAIAVVLVNWWGVMRVIPAMYLVVTLNTYYWGIPEWYLWPVYSASEVIGVLISYLLFRKFANGEYWLPTTRQLILFIVFGLAIPISIELVLLQFTLIYFSHHTYDTFFQLYAFNWLGEFLANFGVSIPLLYYITPIMQKQGWLRHAPIQPLVITKPASIRNKAEMSLIFLFLVVLSLALPFEKYWFVFGIVSLSVAIRYGFGEAALCNLFVFLITYLLPVLICGPLTLFSTDETILSIFLGNLLLSLFAAITGRVITDLHLIEVRLQQKNQELENTNKELDRFVYSASHDLSAPLKSILGLVTISRLETDSPAPRYLNEIEQSVLKLDSFIAEILDYSRNKRLDVTAEQIELKKLCEEILENLRYLENYARIKIELEEFEPGIIHQDKVRLKIILSNLISNAIKFQKKDPTHQPLIRISSKRKSEKTVIQVEDNGEGIKPELSPKIFDMFFRASDRASGSGLGLYIAKESASKIGAKISHHSEFGRGSVFTVELPEL